MVGGIAAIMAERLDEPCRKKLALEIAGACGGIQRIVDRLRVAPAERVGDAAIRDHVRHTLLQEPVLSACSIRFPSGNHMETAREVANEKVKEVAEFDAWYVFGADTVLNRLLVEKT